MSPRVDANDRIPEYGGGPTVAPVVNQNTQASIFENGFTNQNIKIVETSDDWASVSAKENKFLWQTTGYTFTLSDGTKIDFDDIKDVKVYENKKTGEIILMGGNGAKIKGGDGANSIYVYNSTVTSFDMKDGDDKIYLENSTVTGSVETGKGNDKIKAKNSTLKGNVSTGNGNDTIQLYNTTANGNISGGNDNDTIQLNNSTVKGTVNGNDGNDNVYVSGGKVNKIDLGGGNDTLNAVNKANITDVDGNHGNDRITINNSKVTGSIRGGAYLGWGGAVADDDIINILNGAEVNNIGADSGDDTIYVADSKVSGTIEGNGGDDKISIIRSAINKIIGGKDDDSFKFEDAKVNGTLITGANVWSIFSFLNGNDDVKIINSVMEDIEAKGGKNTVDATDSKVGNTDVSGKGSQVNYTNVEAGNVNVNGKDTGLDVEGGSTGNVTHKGDDSSTALSGTTVNGNVNVSGDQTQTVAVDTTVNGNVNVSGDGGAQLLQNDQVSGNVNINGNHNTTNISNTTVDGNVNVNGNNNVVSTPESTVDEGIQVTGNNNTIKTDQDVTILPDAEGIQGVNNYVIELFSLDDMPNATPDQLQTMNILIQNFDNLILQYQNQNGEDGAVSDFYNVAKALLNAGVSSEDVEDAIEKQRLMITELRDSLKEGSTTNFNEVFKKWTGVEYDADKIAEYSQAAQKYQLVQAIFQQEQIFKQGILNCDNLAQVYDKFKERYGDEEVARQQLNRLLQQDMLIEDMPGCWVVSLEINEKGELVKMITEDPLYISGQHDPNSVVPIVVQNLESVENYIQTYKNDYDLDMFARETAGTIEKALGCTIEDLANNYIEAQKETFGKANAFQEVLDKYCADQDGFIDKFARITQIAGISLMVVGGILTIVCPPAGAGTLAAVAGGIKTTGQVLAISGMLGDNALEFVDEITSEDGINQQKAAALFKETAGELIAFFIGQGINNVAEVAGKAAANSQILASLSPKAQAAFGILANVSTDASLSIVSSLIMSGEISLEGESLNVLMAIITGIASAKVGGFSAKPTDTDVKFRPGDVEKLTAELDGFSPEQINTRLKGLGVSDEQIASLNQSAAAGYFGTENYAKFMILKTLGLDDNLAGEFAYEISVKGLENLTSVLAKGIDPDTAYKLWSYFGNDYNQNFDITKIDQVQDLISKGVDFETACSQVMGTPFGTPIGEPVEVPFGPRQNFERMSFEDAKRSYNWDESKYQKYLDLADQYSDIEPNYVQRAVSYNYSDAEIASYMTAIRHGLDEGFGADASRFRNTQWSEEQWNLYDSRMAELSNLDPFSRTNIKNGINENWDISELSKYFDCVKSGMDSHDARVSATRLWSSEENYNKYVEAINKMAKSPNQYQNGLAAILNPDNMSLELKAKILESGLTLDEFLASADKLASSTYKTAMRKPELYISNSNATGDEARMLLNTFFSEHIVEMSRALKYVDTDTLNMMMAKRTTIFAQNLAELDKLSDSAYETLSGLLSCTSADNGGKVLTAKEKVELTKLVQIFQTGRISMDTLNDMAASGSVSISGIKTSVKEMVYQKAGLTPEQIAKIPPELDFNEEFLYMAYSPFYNVVSGRGTPENFDTTPLYTLIREAATGNFEKFIFDESNIYGQANAATKQAFQNNGFNYDAWLKPSSQPIEIEVGGQKLTVNMWGRNPQEDLFVGDKTNCCTQVGRGNGAATPVYLMNTAFNVIELTDPNGNVVGMTRIFVAEVDGKPSICLDNFELNENILRQLSSADKCTIRDGAFAYADSLAKEVIGGDYQILLSGMDTKVGSYDLQSLLLGDTTMIGSLSQTNIYMNAYNTSWQNPTETHKVNWTYAP